MEMGLFEIKISIHAPREGSDAPGAKVLLPSIVISIHAPREGSDVYYVAEAKGQQ